jgi:hypothetical protein
MLNYVVHFSGIKEGFENPLLKLKSVALVRERTIPTERPPLVGEVVPTFSDRGCRVVGATDSPGR